MRTARFEPLEERRLFSNIVWVNRGTGPGDDTDNFNAIYAAQADAARAVVDQAISYWEQVIVDFNYASTGGDGEPAAPNTYELTIDAVNDLDPDDDTLRAETQVTAADGDQKPFAADIRFDDDGAGAGWFIDPTPGDSVEFTSLADNDSGDGGSAILGNDMLRTAMHEIGHSFGTSQSLAVSKYLTPAGVDQVAANDGDSTTNANLWLMTPPGNSVFDMITFTDFGGLHVYEGPTDPAFPNVPVDNNDLLNPGRNSPNSTRRLISDLDAGILQLGYGYTVQPPSEIPNLSYMAQLDQATGVLTVNGDMESAHDVVTLRRSGGMLELDVGGADLQFPMASVTSVVFNPVGLAGDDTISIDFSGGSPVPAGGMTLDGGAGVNTLAVYGTGAVDGFEMPLALGGFTDLVSVNGNAFGYANFQTVNLEGGGGGDTFRVDSAASGVTQVNLIGDVGNDIFDVEGSREDLLVNAYGQADDDTFYLALLEQSVRFARGSVRYDGGDGTDTAELYDRYNPDPNTFVMTDGAAAGEGLVEYQAFAGATGRVHHAGLETLGVFGGAEGNTFDVRQTQPGTDVTLHAGFGHDAVRVPGPGASATVSGVRSHLDIRGELGNDTLLLDDTDRATNSTATVTADTIGAGSNDTFFGPGGWVSYAGLASVTMYTGRLADTVYVRGTAAGATTTIHTGEASDTVVVSSNPDPMAAQRAGTADDVAGPLVLDGQGGADTLVVQDNEDATPDTVTLAAESAVTGTVGRAAGDNYFAPGGGITYTSMSSATLYGGSGGNTVRVTGTVPGTQTAVHAGTGNDTVLVDSNADGAGGTANGVQSKLTVVGQAGHDQLTLHDADDAAMNVLNVTSNTAGANGGDTFFGGGGSLAYNQLEGLRLNLGSGGAHVTVRGTATGTPLSVNGAGGSDTVVVDSNGNGAGGTVGGVQSVLSVHGGPGTNAVYLVNESDAAGDIVTVTAGQVGAGAGDSYFGPGGSMAYTGLATLSLKGSTAGDSITVRATGAHTTIEGSGGHDIIDVDSNGSAPGGTVKDVKHALTLTGGAGLNTLRLEDGSSPTGSVLTVTSNQVGATAGDSFFGAGGSASYGGFSTIKVTTSNFADKVNVRSTAAGSNLLVNTGAGADVVSIDSNGGLAGGTVDGIFSPVTIDAGGADAAADSLLLEDFSDLTADQVTVTPTGAKSGTVGKAAGDNYFGAGGVVNYQNVESLALATGNAAGDTIIAAPSPGKAGTVFSFNGNGPAGGDKLKLLLGGVTSPVLSASGPGAGKLTSASHADLFWSNIESVLPS